MQTAHLLQEAFGESSVTSLAYLDWLYGRNPAGRQIERNLDDAAGRAGHYSVVPQAWTDGDRAWRIALSLNTAVAPRAQGQGLFTRLASGVMTDAAAQGVSGVIGVANANSTPGFLRKLQFQHLGALPVHVGATLPAGAGAAVASVVDGDAAIERIAGFNRLAPRGLRQDWTPATLAWRLHRPGARYIALADSECGLVAALTHQRGLAFTAVLGTFASQPTGGLMRLIALAGDRLGARLHVYAGWNRLTRVTGASLPDALKPSPLNLIWRSLGDAGAGPDIGNLQRFEFLDFDAY